MNILHIAPEYNWSKIFILPIANYQIQQGNEVWISTPNALENTSQLDEAKFVSWNSKYKNIFKHIGRLFLILKMVHKYKINKIYFHTTVDSTLNIFILRLFSSAHLVYVNHGVPYLGYSSIMQYILKLCEIININFSHRSITITQSMKQLLGPLNYKKKEITALIPGTLVGVKIPYSSYTDLQSARALLKTNSDNSILKILYVGRLEHRKGIYDLIEAINHTNLNCELTVLGGTANELETELDLSKVKFEGFQSDLRSYYLNADLLCVPSHHEGFGQVYLEAAAHGVIPVCCNIPGPTDFIKHNSNGFIVEAKSPDSILELFEEINLKKFDLDAIQKRAFESVQAYESSQVISNNMDHF